MASKFGILHRSQYIGYLPSTFAISREMDNAVLPECDCCTPLIEFTLINDNDMQSLGDVCAVVEEQWASKLCDISFETIRHILIKAERFQEFLFGLQNIVNIKDTLVDCSDVAHPTLEKHLKNSTKFT
ncbi:conserved hypothetical protein [Trichinella spiralis]|uniref:hypothetical protein n=1 Tax=Trichinella spiralis TaxID=6334 RepID=UPI0001EFD821|nr:conserved hypothetical protein [Trichinella spiralis]